MTVPFRPICGYYIIVSEYNEFLTHANTFSSCIADAKVFYSGDYLGSDLDPNFLIGSVAVYIDLDKVRTYDPTTQQFT